MDKDFLLGSGTAEHLYHDVAAPLPIVDYHCHIDPREIYEDRRFDDLAEIWLGGKNADGSITGDHYKWRLMRSGGVEEEYITGEKSGYERFSRFASVLGTAAGNPMYHWCHLELQRFFDCRTVLSEYTAKEVWEHCNDKLKNDASLSARGIIKKAGVEFIGTTDDPTDDLRWHDMIARDGSFGTKVCPSFRPDRAILIENKGFAEYIGELARCTGKDSLPGVSDVCDALKERLEFFIQRDCRAADHGFCEFKFVPASVEEADRVYEKALAGEEISEGEAAVYQSVIMMYLGRLYHEKGIVMQIHHSCLRDVNARMYRMTGANTGFDMMTRTNSSMGIVRFLSALDEENACPKTIIYPLDATEFDITSTLVSCFQTAEFPGKIQHGAAWWFNDTKDGMERHLKSVASLGLIGNFVGMLTDSRSFLSYARHEYFRRILCNLIGGWVENGEFPDDDAALERIVRGVCYENAVRYFG